MSDTCCFQKPVINVKKIKCMKSKLAEQGMYDIYGRPDPFII